jgi:hypothetical protein
LKQEIENNYEMLLQLCKCYYIIKQDQQKYYDEMTIRSEYYLINRIGNLFEKPEIQKNLIKYSKELH